MEHFTKNVSEDDDLDFSSRSKDYNDLDIEAILERSRNSSFRRSRPLYEAPEFVLRLEAFEEVCAGGSVTFQCQWKACPRPQIKWFKDDEEITTDHPYFTIESDDNDGFVRLTLTDLTKQDEGAYKCKAENQEGVASTTGYLSVTGDDSDKTLNSQQKAAKSQNTNSPTSPNISLAPHLCTILEQQSLEEREAEAQRRLPPSPLQDYIETVQKTKTWPLAKMGYNPDDFMKYLEVPNGITSEDNEDAQSSSSDTSVDSQPETSSKVTTSVQPRSSTAVKSITKVTIQHHSNDPVPRAESIESDHDSDEDDNDSNEKPVCTISVQMRSESGISRLTKIRQDEKDRLCLLVTAGSKTPDTEDKEVTTEESPEQETPKVSKEQLALEKIMKSAECKMEAKDSKTENHHDNNMRIIPSVILPVSSSNNGQVVHSMQLTDSMEDVVTPDIVTPDTVQETSTEIKLTDHNLEATQSTEIIKDIKTSTKRHIAHQKSRERRSQVKKQKSLVEITFEWLFQRITGKVGEHLELPWIYYFAFTVLCGCFCAAIRLNPFYMIVIVALLSILSFRFILSEQVEVTDSSENLDMPEKVQNE